MKTTLEELRNNNFGYTLGKDGITESDLRLVNGIIDKIEQTRTREPQPLDVVEYTDTFGCYYPNAIIDGNTYWDGSTALCECGSAYVSVAKDGTLCKSVSGGAFPVINKDKLLYIGRKEKTFWTFSTLGAGPQHGLYFKAEVSCFELNLREEPLKKYTTKDYDYIFVQDWGNRTSDCGYKYTVTKGPYPHCAFYTKEELNEYLTLYEAVEEPYFDNDSLRKKYWILKSAFVSVWTEDEFGKIKADRTKTSLFNGRQVPTKYVKDSTTLLRYVLRTDEISP